MTAVAAAPTFADTAASLRGHLPRATRPRVDGTALA